MARLPALLIALATLAGYAPALAETTPSNALIEELISATSARPSECPEGLDAYGTTASARCAIAGVPAKAVKRTLRSTLRKDNDSVRLPGALWESRHEYELARFFVGRELFILRYDPRDGGLAFLPHQSCFSPISLANAGVATPRDSGVVAPELLELPRPDYPKAARAERRNGFVMVQAVVDGDGSVARQCVLYGIPEGLGFFEAALEAVAAARYRPGTRDGAPAAVLVNESVTWEPR